MGCDYCNGTGKVTPFVGETHACPKCSILAMPHHKAVNAKFTDATLTAMFAPEPPQVFDETMIAVRVFHKDDPAWKAIRDFKITNRFTGPFDTTFPTKPDTIRHSQNQTLFIKDQKSGVYFKQGHFARPLIQDEIDELHEAYHDNWRHEHDDQISAYHVGNMCFWLHKSVITAHEEGKITDEECLSLSKIELCHQEGILNRVLDTGIKIQNEIDFEASLEATEICYHQHRDGNLHKVLNCVYYAHAHKLIDDNEYESIGMRPLSQQAAILTLMKPGIQTTTKFKEEFISGIKDSGIKDSGLPDPKIQRLCNPTISSIVSLLRAVEERIKTDIEYMRETYNDCNEAQSLMLKRVGKMRMALAKLDASMMGRVHQLDRLVTNESLISRQQAEEYRSNLERMNRG